MKDSGVARLSKTIFRQIFNICRKIFLLSLALNLHYPVSYHVINLKGDSMLSSF